MEPAWHKPAAGVTSRPLSLLGSGAALYSLSCIDRAKVVSVMCSIACSANLEGTMCSVNSYGRCGVRSLEPPSQTWPGAHFAHCPY